MGTSFVPGTPDYDVHRKIWNGSFDRHPAVIVRCAGVSDVIAAVKLGRESGLPVAVRSGGPLVPGPLGRRRRADDRPLADEGRPRRSREANGARASGRSARGARPGDAGVRARGAVGHRHAHRRRRAHARRRDRLDHAQARAVGRPARLGRPRDGRRRVRQGERGRERGSLLGRARRRRQLRDRHGVRVPLRAAGDAGAGRADLLADGAVRGGPALLSRLGRGRAGRADDDRHPPQGAAAAVRPGGAAREARRDGRPLLGRRHRGGGEVHPAAAGVRLAGRGRLRPEAVSRAPGDVRPELRAAAVGTTSRAATSPS